jgi:predicted transglutaminase-like cysteine proteinase
MSIFSTAARAFVAAIFVGFAGVQAFSGPIAPVRPDARLVSPEIVGRPSARLVNATATSLPDRDHGGRPNSEYLFGLPTVSSRVDPIAAKWQDLRGRIAADEKVLERCRLDRRDCPAAGEALLQLVESARTFQGRARIGQINRAVNLQIRPMSDEAQYGVPDYWASPLETFASGAGDCEDYAIAKYVALQYAGFSRDDLRLVIVQDLQHSVVHAIAAVRHDGEWLLLDNRSLILVNAQEARHYRPVVVMDDDGVKEFRVAYRSTN